MIILRIIGALMVSGFIVVASDISENALPYITVGLLLLTIQKND